MGVGDWEEYLARRKGREYEIYEPRRSYMAETVGTMTYQEQFLLDANKLAGWEIAYADKHIRKNKDIRNDEALREKFFRDCQGNEHSEQVCKTVWQEIEDAVDGGLNDGSRKILLIQGTPQVDNPERSPNGYIA